MTVTLVLGVPTAFGGGSGSSMVHCALSGGMASLPPQFMGH